MNEKVTEEQAKFLKNVVKEFFEQYIVQLESAIKNNKKKDYTGYEYECLVEKSSNTAQRINDFMEHRFDKYVDERINNVTFYGLAVEMNEIVKSLVSTPVLNRTDNFGSYIKQSLPSVSSINGDLSPEKISNLMIDDAKRKGEDKIDCGQLNYNNTFGIGSMSDKGHYYTMSSDDHFIIDLDPFAKIINDYLIDPSARVHVDLTGEEIYETLRNMAVAIDANSEGCIKGLKYGNTANKIAQYFNNYGLLVYDPVISIEDASEDTKANDINSTIENLKRKIAEYENLCKQEEDLMQQLEEIRTRKQVVESDLKKH